MCDCSIIALQKLQIKIQMKYVCIKMSKFQKALKQTHFIGCQIWIKLLSSILQNTQNTNPK